MGRRSAHYYRRFSGWGLATFFALRTFIMDSLLRICTVSTQHFGDSLRRLHFGMKVEVTIKIGCNIKCWMSEPLLDCLHGYIFLYTTSSGIESIGHNLLPVKKRNWKSVDVPYSIVKIQSASLSVIFMPDIWCTVGSFPLRSWGSTRQHISCQTKLRGLCGKWKNRTVPYHRG